MRGHIHPIASCCYGRDPAVLVQRTPPRAELQAEYRNQAMVIVPVHHRHKLGPEKGQKSVFQLLPGRVALPHPPNESGNTQKGTTKKSFWSPAPAPGRFPAQHGAAPSATGWGWSGCPSRVPVSSDSPGWAVAGAGPSPGTAPCSDTALQDGGRETAPRQS